MESVVIVGGGHVGVTLAIDLYRRREETGLEPHLVLLRDGVHPLLSRDSDRELQIENIITGDKWTQVFPSTNIHKISQAPAPLFDRCSMVIVTAPDIPSIRKPLFDQIAALSLSPSVPIVFVRGGQGGLIWLTAAHQLHESLRRSTFVLVEDSFYGTRFIGDQIEFKRKRKTNIAASGPDPQAAIALLQRAFDGPSVGSDWNRFSSVSLLELLFDPLGYIIHLGVALDDINLERTGRGEQYLHYSGGVHVGNADKLERLDQERVALAAEYGASARLFSDMIVEQYGIPRQDNFLNLMKSTVAIYRSMSAVSINDLKNGRVLQEDIPAMLTIEWLAEKAGLELPTTTQHTQDILRKTEILFGNIEPFYEYRRELERLSIGKTDVLRLLNS